MQAFPVSLYTPVQRDGSRTVRVGGPLQRVTGIFLQGPPPAVSGWFQSRYHLCALRHIVPCVALWVATWHGPFVRARTVPAKHTYRVDFLRRGCAPPTSAGSDPATGADTET